jgi:hypothetical protein
MQILYENTSERILYIKMLFIGIFSVRDYGH